MKKTKSLIFAMALVVMVFASAAFADTAEYIANDGSKLYAVKLSGDAFVSVDITASADLKAAKFIEFNSKVYVPGEDKLTEVKADLTSTDTAIAGAGQINSIATSGDTNVLVAGATKGFLFKDNTFAEQLASGDAASGDLIAGGAVSNDENAGAAGSGYAIVWKKDIKKIAVITLSDDANTPAQALSSDATKWVESEEVVGLVTLGKVIYIADKNGLASLDVASDDAAKTAYNIVRNSIGGAGTGKIKAIAVAGTTPTLYILSDDMIYTTTDGKAITAKSDASVLKAPASTTTDTGTGGTASLAADDETPAAATVVMNVAEDGKTITIADGSSLVVVVLSEDKYCFKAKLDGVTNVAKLAVAGVEFSTTTDETDTETAGSAAAVDIDTLTGSADILNTLGISSEDCIPIDKVESADLADGEFTTESDDIAKEVLSTDMGFGTIKNVVALKRFKNTNTEDGYIFVPTTRPSAFATVDVSKFVIVFVKLSKLATVANVALAADTDDAVTATLFDADGQEITSGTLPESFTAAAELKAGEDYTMVAAETEAEVKEADPDPDPDPENTTVSKSSSGCDAGFGIWSLAALLAITKLGKRR